MFHTIVLAYPAKMFVAIITPENFLDKCLRNTENTTRQIKMPHKTCNTIDCECENSTDKTGLTIKNKSVNVRPAKKNPTSVTAVNTSAVLKSGCFSTSKNGTINSPNGTKKDFNLCKLTGCFESQYEIVIKYAIFANSEGCNLITFKSIQRPAPFTSPANMSTNNSKNRAIT